MDRGLNALLVLVGIAFVAILGFGFWAIHVETMARIERDCPRSVQP